MYKYEIIIYWDNQDKICIAEVPELPGCLAHGSNYDETLHNKGKQLNYGLTQLKNSAIQYPRRRDKD